ncbi:hypothetical protein NA57DRAFT_70003 [Rhizodiscina lignyota]|uniref:Uncharacterized protein n=1 Tax=Rhizodiscina lignyota TaxID=1504668 RepID=A0A9P4MAZ6_9PEZI|nr:hypothetical protein NA57DRAFT_70003 [Rhizodiscina lignyota]
MRSLESMILFLGIALSLLGFLLLAIFAFKDALASLGVVLISNKTHTDYDWPRSPSAHHHSSPDTTSPMYPDRLIRPLPKRRLRSRLSDEEAKSIEFPPAPPTVAPLFNLPYVEKSPNYTNRVPRGDGDDHKCQCGADHGVGHDAAYVENVDGANDRGRRATSVEAAAGEEYLPWEQSGGSFAKPPPPGSTTSSADGYESFENTNNKKKRKIPLSGGSNHHHASLSAEMVNMSISNPANDSSLLEDSANGAGQYYSAAPSALPNTSSGTGISGAGRGRFGRPKHSMERRPLGASTNGLNAFASNHSGNGAVKGKRDWAASGGKDQGIISAAIANAAEQGHKLPPLEGSENVSLLQQQAAKSVPPQSSQFTFSMDSESGKALYGASGHTASNVLPGSSHVPPAGYGMKAYPPGRAPNTVPPPPGQQQQYAQQPSKGNANNGGAGAEQRPKGSRKSLTRILQLAANQRKLQQEYTNFHHPPRREDIWICEFCEYKSIFGEEPAALVRQYEEKDRRERKAAAERRRLLEKAKMKGRKNRKGNKGKNKGGGSHANNTSTNNANSQQYDQGADSVVGQLDPQEEEFFDDEFDDEPIAQGPPPPPTPTTEPIDHGALSAGGMTAGAGGGGGTTHGPPRATPASRTRKA